MSTGGTHHGGHPHPGQPPVALATEAQMIDLTARVAALEAKAGITPPALTVPPSIPPKS